MALRRGHTYYRNGDTWVDLGPEPPTRIVLGLFFALLALPVLAAIVFMALLYLAATARAADVPQHVIDACQSDALRLCAREVLSGDQVRAGACMRHNHHALSAPCQAALRRWIQSQRGD